MNQRLAPQFLQSVRRSFWSAIAVIAAIIPFGVLAPLGSAAAQSFPSQTVRIVVPTPPGS